MNFDYPIYCINLVERTDRKEHVMNEFNKIGIDSSNVKFPIFNRDVRGGKYGCYDSHVKIWNDFYQNSNCNYCLIFEDDIISNNNTVDLLQKSKLFMQNNHNNVDFLFLHNLFIKSNEKINCNTVNNEYFSKGFGLLAHAYFISRKYIELLIKQYNYIWLEPNGFDIDFTINCNRKHCLYSNKCYFTQQEMFTQILNASNNCETLIDILYRIPIIQYFGKDILHNVKEVCEIMCICSENEIKDQIYNIVSFQQNINNK
jgi:GR25 family glycosyltransferase involved in LPS biosynthesis